MKRLNTTITLILLAAFSGAFHLTSVGQAIQNDGFWHDTSGNPIYSQGGGVLKLAILTIGTEQSTMAPLPITTIYTQVKMATLDFLPSHVILQQTWQIGNMKGK